MNCDQIRDLLDDYNANQLAGYKVTWVAQHLGGCQACRAHAERPPVVYKPVQPAVEWPAAGPGVESKRARFGWIFVAGFGLILCAALLMLAIQHLNQAQSSMFRPQRLRYESAAQTQLGVTATVVELVRHEDVVTGVVRFHGQGLVLPERLENWVVVVDSAGNALETIVQEVIPSQLSLSVRFVVDLPPEIDTLSLLIGAVHLEISEPWSVQLPRPMNGLGGEGVRLLGNPAGVRLVAYGLVGDMLVVHLRAPVASGRLAGSRLVLLDAAGTQVAPALVQETSGGDDHAMWIQYPVPRETHLPFRLVGERFSRKEIGPWYLPISLVP